MRQFKIPKAFTLFGTRYTVERDETLALGSQALGTADFNNNAIKIMPSLDHFPISREKQEEVFCHELTHIILERVAGAELTHDENLVDLVGSCIHQFIKTAEYPLEERPASPHPLDRVKIRVKHKE